MINGLQYLVVHTRDLPGWRRLGTDLVGLHAEEVATGALRLRMDGQAQRFLVEAVEGPVALTFGFGVDGPQDCDAVSRRLEQAGVEVTESTADERSRRGVDRMLHFRDPDGYRVEIACGFQDASAPLVRASSFVRQINHLGLALELEEQGLQGAGLVIAEAGGQSPVVLRAK